MNVPEKHRDIAHAWVDGAEVEYRSPASGWRPLGGTLGPSWLEDYEYRIKPTKPSIDWSHVAAGLNWLAVDDDDSACLFLCRPQINAQGFWEKTGHGISHSVNAEMFASFKPGTCDWRDSLIVRPGYEESGS